jgi:hypothetical protein
VASFNLIRYRRGDDSTFLNAFDLIELNGDDLRRDPLEVRKATLASIVAKALDVRRRRDRFAASRSCPLRVWSGSTRRPRRTVSCACLKQLNACPRGQAGLWLRARAIPGRRDR